jgi:hypothetical protein
MTTRRTTTAGMLGASVAALAMAIGAMPAVAQQVDNDDIGGVVRSATGPEAGVWVVAETRELPTRYIKIVVTDAQGRYVLPDLPGRATYDVWVRGYGLVDSPKQKSTPGKTLNLTAVKAPNRAAAAEYYPAGWWYSMLKIPAANQFPGTGPNGNGMSPAMKDQGLWLRYVKTDACVGCHQIGGKATRTIPSQLGHFNTGAEAWERRIQSGQAGRNMVDAIGRFDTQVHLANLGDWTDRIAKGELPSSDPPRPQGRERNIVVTQWDWNTPQGYLHDEIATDRNNPTVNGNGLIYGATEASSDMIPWLDPVDNTAGLLKTEFKNPRTPSTGENAQFYADSPYWGKEVVWDSHTNTHNPMFDSKGRLWLTARIRPNDNPAFCKVGSNHPSARIFPTQTSGRQAEVYDPSTKQITMVDLCFSTHHLQFDKSGILWFSSGGGAGGVIGWLDVNKFDQTKDEQASQAWSPFVLDTNGNGVRDAGWAEPNAPLDRTKDKRIVSGIYGVSPSPADGSVWGSVTGFPGGVLRFDPKTQLTEYYEVPWKNAKVAPQGQGFSPRGNDITTNGVVWTVLASGHLASFDRKLCNANNIKGPAIADPQNACPEGWKLYQLPGPEFDSVKGVPGAGVEAPYYNWVDQHDTFGLGRDVPIATGNETDSLAALVNNRDWVVLRVAYPMGYFAKGLDGRIDDPSTGWKGKGLWSTYSTRAAHHIEGGKGNTSKVVKFQLRPDPLAK